MSYAEFCRIIYTTFEPDHTWYKFYQTRDWYDLPDSIRENDWLYRDTEAVQRNPYRQSPGRRFLIYPKDVELIYDFTPDMARNFLNEVREYLGLSIGSPVTYYDLQAHTLLDLETILDFIMES